MSTKETGGPTILIAEDDRAIRFSLACSLKADGYRVIEVGDGNEAIACIARERPDAVLLDLKMPGATGWPFSQSWASRSQSCPSS